jgi:glucose/arabinose dehydrogenase
MKSWMILFAVTGLLCLSNCKKTNTKTETQTSDAEITDAVLTQQLTYPWEILWAPDGQLWITERGGRISRINPTNGQITQVINISDVVSQGEGGLLGMVLHPDFGTVPQVFVAYNYNKGGAYTEKIVRYTYNGTTLTNPVILLDNIAAAGNHNGCRLAISPDKKLYITTGDAAVSSRAQDLNNISGKILRINLDGSVPADNPTTGSPVWSFGHRNAQGLVFANNRLYSSEHGNTTDDEINIIQKGRNFGWPNVEGFCSTGTEPAFCSTNNVVEPIYAWSPTIAPSGIDYYDNSAIPQWKNSLILAVLKDSQLMQIKLNDAGDRAVSATAFYKNKYGRMRDVCVAPDGKIYIITSNGSNDKIIVLAPKQ